MKNQPVNIVFEFYLEDGNVVDLKYFDCKDSTKNIADLLEQALEDFRAMCFMMNLPKQEPLYKISLYPSEFDEIMAEFEEIDDEDDDVDELEIIEVLPELTVSDLEKLYNLPDDLHK